jgi:hypothetical protein
MENGYQDGCGQAWSPRHAQTGTPARVAGSLSVLPDLQKCLHVSSKLEIALDAELHDVLIPSVPRKLPLPYVRLHRKTSPIV